MNSDLFNQLGMGSIDIGYILLGMTITIVLLLIILVVNMISTSRLKKRLNLFLKGKEGQSLEEDIINLFEDNKVLKSNSEKHKKELRIISRKLEKCYQKMGLVKYDAFRQMGGQLSFSLCLLDENNDGFVINSVHGTEGCYSYTKEIKKGESTLSLGEEETEALKNAMGE